MVKAELIESIYLDSRRVRCEEIKQMAEGRKPKRKTNGKRNKSTR